MGPSLLLGAGMHGSLLLKALLAGALERGYAARTDPILLEIRLQLIPRTRRPL
jgi:hypothetical protein